MILRLISIVLITSTLSGQKIDVYSRPVRTLPDFDIDVIHYDIHLRIAEQEKSFFHACNKHILSHIYQLQKLLNN